jgi:hypothetical protein
MIPVEPSEIFPVVDLEEFPGVLLRPSLGNARGQYPGSSERSDTYTPALYMISMHIYQLKYIPSYSHVY